MDRVSRLEGWGHPAVGERVAIRWTAPIAATVNMPWSRSPARTVLLSRHDQVALTASSSHSQCVVGQDSRTA